MSNELVRALNTIMKPSFGKTYDMTYYQLGREKAKQGRTRKQVEQEYPRNPSVLIGFDDWHYEAK